MFALLFRLFLPRPCLLLPALPSAALFPPLGWKRLVSESSAYDCQSETVDPAAASMALEVSAKK